MSVDTDTRTLVLHGLRLKGFAEVPAIAGAVGVAETDAKSALDELTDQGLASYRDGRMSGFTLTPEGRVQHARLLADELDRNGVRGEVDALYRRFLQHNGDLLAVCTDWQLKPGAGEPQINDHSDPAYDRGVIDRLAEINSRVEPVCVDLAGVLSRFGRYQPALAHALTMLHSGDLDWFTKPMIDSYHTVWFELHEDLLATLGIERGSEEVT